MLRSPSRSRARRSIRSSSTAAQELAVVLDGEVFSILGFTVAGGKIVEIDALADPERIAQLDLSAWDAR